MIPMIGVVSQKKAALGPPSPIAQYGKYVNSGIDISSLSQDDPISRWDDLIGTNYMINVGGTPSYSTQTYPDGHISFGNTSYLSTNRNNIVGSTPRTIMVYGYPQDNWRYTNFLFTSGNHTAPAGGSIKIFADTYNNKYEFNPGSSPVRWNGTPPRSPSLITLTLNGTNESAIFRLNGIQWTRTSIVQQNINTVDGADVINGYLNGTAYTGGENINISELYIWDSVLSETDLLYWENFIMDYHTSPFVKDIQDYFDPLTIENLNIVYDLVVDFIQTNPINDRINNAIDFLQKKKEGQPQEIIDRINDIIELLLESLD